MKFEALVGYWDEKFRRITGVKCVTFEKMLEILRCAFVCKHVRVVVNQNCFLRSSCLQLWSLFGKYRTYAYVAASYQINESNIYRMIRWVEDTLIKDGTFSLPERKALLKSDSEYGVILIG